MQNRIPSDHIDFTSMPGMGHVHITSLVARSSGPSQMPVDYVSQCPRKETSGLRRLAMTLRRAASLIDGRSPALDRMDRVARLGGRPWHRHRTAS